MKKSKCIVLLIFILGLPIYSLLVDNSDYQDNFYMYLKTSSNTDWLNPTIVENIDNNGGMSLYSLFNVKNQNDQYAYITLPPLAKTKWIRCTGFGFDLPDNSVIEGIEVQIDDFDGMFNSILAQDIYLVLNDAKIGIDKESGTPIGTTDTDTYRVYGSPTDIWNTELTQTDIEGSTFGVQIYYRCIFEFSDVNIDNIQIKVYYSISDDDNEPPTWDSLIESSDPLELGNTEIININVYDESTISFVYIDINSVNYTMDFISGDNYRYSTWTPITIGVKNYSIWLIDEFNNINWTGIYDITVIEPETNIDFIIIFGLIGIFSIFILILMFSILLIKKVN